MICRYAILLLVVCQTIASAQVVMHRRGAFRFTPASIPNLAFVLDSNDLVALADNDNITSWTGIVSSSATPPGTAPKKQTYNGFPVCRFTANDQLTSNSFLSTAFDTSFTVVRVARVADTSNRVIAGHNGTEFYTSANTSSFTQTFFASGLSDTSISVNQVRQEFAVVIMRYDGATKKIRFNAGADTSESATGNLGLSGALTLGSLSGGTSDWSGDLAFIACYSRALSDTECELMRAYLTRRFSGLAGWGSIIFEGDSLTAGQGASDANHVYPKLVRDEMDADGLTYNYYLNSGQGGDTLEQMDTAFGGDLGNDFDTQIDPYGFRQRDVVVLWGGTNDIAAAASLATVETRLQTLAEAIRAAGAKVVVLTCIARSNHDAAEETVRTDYNTWIRANWTTFADKLVDVANEPEFDAQADTSNLTYYGDGVHLTDAGYAIIAAKVYAAINPW